VRAAEILRSALVIARRDFTATVMSRSFVFFLLGPLFPLAVGVGFGLLGAKMDREADAPVLAVVLPPAEAAQLVNARNALAPVLGSGQGRPPLELQVLAPSGDPERQRQALLDRSDKPVLGVLDGTLAHPRLSGALSEDGWTLHAASVLVDDARRRVASGGRTIGGDPVRFSPVDRSSASIEDVRKITARAGQTLQFFLVLLLAGMLLSQFVEEKSNKVLEVLAAAVPIDSIFLGKLLAMLGASVVGIALWSAMGAVALHYFSTGGATALPPPAVGWPAFIALGLLYFAMAYLLIGALFLGIGAQASTVREVQTMSMPITMGQLLLFALCASVADKPYSDQAMIAAAIPFSSPFAMFARAAQVPGLWLHVVALAWQLLWAGLLLVLGARLFRRNVLKSGPQRRSWWRRQRR
jgi:ABC-2 type transport system permease protein